MSLSTALAHLQALRFKLCEALCYPQLFDCFDEFAELVIGVLF